MVLIVVLYVLNGIRRSYAFCRSNFKRNCEISPIKLHCFMTMWESNRSNSWVLRRLWIFWFLVWIFWFLVWIFVLIQALRVLSYLFSQIQPHQLPSVHNSSVHLVSQPWTTAFLLIINFPHVSVIRPCHLQWSDWWLVLLDPVVMRLSTLGMFLLKHQVFKRTCLILQQLTGA